jgi:hypothetical protein
MTGAWLEGFDRFIWLNALGSGLWNVSVQNLGQNPMRYVTVTTGALSKSAEREGRLSLADAVSQQTQVQRITYNSPLEVIVQIGAAGGVATLLLNRIVDSFNRVQEARVGRAAADYRVAAYKAMEEQLRAELPDPQMRRWGTLKDAMQSAAPCLASLEALDIVQRDD